MTTAQRVFWLIAIFGNILAISLTLYTENLWAIALLALTLVYGGIGLYDLNFSHHTLNRLYPVIAYFRYFFESIRVEIQQYFIASDIEEMPFNREQRSLVYRRSKGISDTIPFGTQRDLSQTNYQSIWHSMAPKVLQEDSKRINVGSSQCSKPYSASRLNISAMSYGALSSHAVEAMNLGAKQGGFYHNTGEGAISPHHQKHGGDLVWQLGTGLFGCRDEHGRFNPTAFTKLATLDQVKMIEIKLSQGAKPGHGGVLPKAKITDEIAQIRGINKDKDCVSPPMNPEFSTPLELLNFVKQLRKLSGGKPIGIKLCIGNPAEFLCFGKAMIETGTLVDFITVDGAEGGTGAAPVEFTNRLGLMCLEGVYFVNNVLTGLGLRSQIKVIASGKTATGFDIVNKVAFGADIVNAARTFMLSVGCIQSKQCDTNKCPTGIATQDKNRSKAINVKAKSKRVTSFHKLTLHSFYELIGAMGLEHVSQLTYNMIKRRTPNGMLESSTHTLPELKSGQLLDHSQHTENTASNKSTVETNEPETELLVQVLESTQSQTDQQDNKSSVIPLPGLWATWWQQARSDSFYIKDTAPLYPPELAVKNI